MTDMQAALGLHPLARLERMHPIREQWRRYDDLLPYTAGFRRPSTGGIGTGVHYLCVSEHSAYDGMMNVPVPNAVPIKRETMSLPLGGALTAAQQDHVIEILSKLLKTPSGP
jgi:dTDP-4-amino-4,6-dideoxygalactose transaminase